MAQARLLAVVAAGGRGSKTPPTAPRNLPRARGPGNRAWLWFLLAGTVCAGIYVGPGIAGLGGTVLYDGIGLAGAVAIVVGARRNRPRAALAWYLLAVGQLLFVLGDALWGVFDLLGDTSLTLSWADLLYLSGYLPIIASVLMLVRERSSGRDRAGLIDATIITTTVGVYAWIFWIQPYVADSTISIPERLISAAYPLLDLVLVAVIARLVISVGSRSASYGFLLGSCLLLLTADIIYGVQALAAAYVGGLTTDGFWLLSYVAFGCAALHPSMTALTEPLSAQRERPNKVRLAIFTSALLLMPGVVALQALMGQPIAVIVIVGGSAALALLVLARLTGLVGEVELRVEQLQEQKGVLRAALAEREALSEQLKHQAFHDPLTGAANRILFADRINHAFARSGRTGETLAVLFLDLDDFKSVNDSMGHAAGDELLTAVVGRLKSCLRPEDTVARIGGDEFAILLEGADAKRASTVTQRLLDNLSLPLEISGELISVQASIGVDVESGGGGAAENLLRNADVAMYEAKRAGKNRYAIFEADMHSGAMGRLQTVADLGRAIRDGGLTVRYQPVVELETHRVVGAEALVRWIHAERGLVLPSEFVPLAEDAGMIGAIDGFVLREALREVALWRSRAASKRVEVSINLSTVGLGREDWCELVAELLRDFRLPGSALLVEVAEAQLLRCRDVELRRLRALSDLGVRIAVDDLDIGLASPGRLRRLPVDVVKVSTAVLERSSSGPGAISVAAQVAELRREVGVVPLVKCVESEEQAARARALGFRLGQGYLFGGPERAAQALIVRPGIPAESVPAVSPTSA